MASIDILSLAKKHAIRHELAAPDFFEGAFLVDAACGGGKVDFVRVTAETGGLFRLENPWSEAEDSLGRVYPGKTVEISMEAGQTLTLREAVR